MYLTMVIGEKVIDTIPVRIDKITNTEYVESLKGKLEEKHEDILDLTEEKPVFFIDRVPSTMNKRAIN